MADHRDRKDVLLADFALQRQASVNLLNNMKERDWDRKGHHPELGMFTARTWVEHWVGHDADHVAQIERTLGTTLAEVFQRRARPAE